MGEMIQFDEHMFQLGGEKPPTSMLLPWLLHVSVGGHSFPGSDFDRINVVRGRRWSPSLVVISRVSYGAPLNGHYE